MKNIQLNYKDDSGTVELLELSGAFSYAQSDVRYVFTSSYGPFTSSINNFTSSFSSSIKFIGDSRYVLTSSYDLFTSSFSASVQTIGDTRYVLTASAKDQSVSGNVALSNSLYFVSNSQYHLRAASSHLILSSTLGSVVAFSSSQDFTNTDKDYHIRSVNSHLVLSSSAGSIVTLSSTLDIAIFNKNYHLRAINSHLIFSSSVGSVIAFSGSQDFTNTDKIYHLRTVNGDLILSSSTSIVTISAALDVTNIGPKNYNLRNPKGHLILSSSIGSVIASSASIDLVNTDKTYHVRSVNSNLIFSSSVGSVVSFSASQDFPNTDKIYHINAVNSHLVLSSSAGSVTISGNLLIKTAGKANVGRVGINSDPSANSSMLSITTTGTLDYASEGWRVSSPASNIFLIPHIAAGAYNPISSNSDIAFVFTSGTTSTGSLALVPWHDAGGGYKIYCHPGDGTVWHAWNIATPTVPFDFRTNVANIYAGLFFNDGNNANRNGIAIQCGEATPTSNPSAVFIDFKEQDAALTGRISANNTGVVSYVDSSDIRKKLNIAPTQIQALPMLLSMSMIEFNRFKDMSDGKRHVYAKEPIGFSAQNLQQVFPRAVTEGFSGSLMVDKASLIPLLVKAIQEMFVEIDKLKIK